MNNEKNTETAEAVVIPDECGDSMWDEVLQQNVKVCQLTEGPENKFSIIQKMEVKATRDSHHT